MNFRRPENMNNINKKHRERKVLEIIVQSHITTGAPVSSRYVSHRLDLSSATIRNIMADLEDMRLLGHPHTSAGRIPTDRGYRYYVDSLMHLQKIAEAQIRQIEHEYQSKVRSLEDVVEKTVRILSEFSGCAGITLLPGLERKCFRHVDLVQLSRRRVLVLLVAKSGFVKDYIIEFESPPDKDLLKKVSTFLNSEFCDMPLEDIKEGLVRRLKAERDSSQLLINAAHQIITAALMKELKEKLYYNGTSSILKYPEFNDGEKSRNILRFFEEEKAISSILCEDLCGDGLKIHIGWENSTYGLDDFSLITAGFKMMGQSAGRLGIIGPLRMDYDRVIPLVDLLSATVTRALSGQD